LLVDGDDAVEFLFPDRTKYIYDVDDVVVADFYGDHGECTVAIPTAARFSLPPGSISFSSATRKLQATGQLLLALGTEQ
jgi:hypothetical protein